MGRLHADALRLLHHVACVKVSGDVANEGLIGREQEDHRFGFGRAAILGRYQAELRFLLDPLGAQQRHATRSASPSTNLGPRTCERRMITESSRDS